MRLVLAAALLPTPVTKPQGHEAVCGGDDVPPDLLTIMPRTTRPDSATKPAGLHIRTGSNMLRALIGATGLWSTNSRFGHWR